jgi:hypothetical protein
LGRQKEKSSKEIRFPLELSYWHLPGTISHSIFQKVKVWVAAVKVLKREYPQLNEKYSWAFGLSRGELSLQIPHIFRQKIVTTV